MGVAKVGSLVARRSGAGPRAAEDGPEPKVSAVDRVAAQNDAAAAVPSYVISHEDRRAAPKIQLKGGLGGGGGGKHGDVDRVGRVAQRDLGEAEGRCGLDPGRGTKPAPWSDDVQNTRTAELYV